MSNVYLQSVLKKHAMGPVSLLDSLLSERHIIRGILRVHQTYAGRAANGKILEQSTVACCRLYIRRGGLRVCVWPECGHQEQEEQEEEVEKLFDRKIHINSSSCLGGEIFFRFLREKKVPQSAGGIYHLRRKE